MAFVKSFYFWLPLVGLVALTSLQFATFHYLSSNSPTPSNTDTACSPNRAFEASPKVPRNGTLQAPPKVPRFSNDGSEEASACILVCDDNHFLIGE